MVIIFKLGIGSELITMDWNSLEQSKKMVDEGNRYIMPSYEKLVSTADRYLKVDRYTVVDKEIIAPSGDPHDYMSFGPYWWPNPNTKDGLPYIQRDGETNPESRKADKERMVRFTDAVESLSLAYYFTGEQEYAEKSAHFMRVWFIDEDTKMNPNLKYGQGIPGRVDGRYIGIIDSRVLLKVIDGIALIEKSEVLSKDEIYEIKLWFFNYLKWLVEGEYAKEVDRHYNNHGTYYDMQIAGIALFANNEEFAKGVVERSQSRRLLSHINSKGENPGELRRTRPYHYSVFDLEALLTLANYSNRFDGMDYWNISNRGASLKKAIEFINIYTFNLDKWEKDGYLGRSEKKPDYARSYSVLAQGARVYGLDEYKENLEKIWEKNPANRDILKWSVEFED